MSPRSTGGPARAAGSLTENETPASPASGTPKLLTENEPPLPPGAKGPHLTTKEEVEAKQQDDLHKTRTRLAMGMFWLVAALTMIPVLALIFGKQTGFTVDQFKELGLFFTPVVTLASAAFGFFFASDERKRR